MARNKNGQFENGKPLPVDIGSWGHNLSDRGIGK